MCLLTWLSQSQSHRASQHLQYVLLRSYVSNPVAGLSVHRSHHVLPWSSYIWGQQMGVQRQGDSDNVQMYDKLRISNDTGAYCWRKSGHSEASCLCG